MRPGVLTVGLLAVSLTLVSCGSSPLAGAPGAPAKEGADPYSSYAALTGRERTEKLLADAKDQGGVLDLYTSNTDIQDLVTGFEKAYPAIKVNAFRANSETVLQRALQENRANKPQNDVIDTDDVPLRALDDQKLLHPYDGPALAGLKDTAKGLGGWTAERFNAFVVGWNTDLVPAGSEPKSFTELAEPRWKGKVSVEVGDWDWYASMYTYLTEKKGMSKSAADAFFKKLAGNVKVTKGHTVQGELLSAGAFSVALSVYSHTIDKAAKDGAPVSRTPSVDPVILRPNGVGLMTRPRHAAAALLWTDWVLSDGQRIIAQSLRLPAAKSVAGFKDPIPAGTTTYSLSKTAETDTTTWNADYDALLRGVAKAG